MHAIARSVTPEMPAKAPWAPHCKPRLWSMFLWGMVVLLMLPSLVVLSSFFLPDEAGTLTHLFHTVMGRYLSNALLLLTGVGLLSAICGTLTAWLVTMYEFPLRRILALALMLPLAVPAYVLAMIYGYQLDSAGVVQTWLRGSFGWHVGEYWFPAIRSTGGAILVLGIASYGYVYMLARMAFMRQSCQLLDSAKMLGVSGLSLMLRVGLPMARPAIVVGLALVGMETLADFGTVSLYGVESFTTGIYRSWFGMGDMNASAKLSAMLLLFVLAILWIERRSRAQAKYYNATALYHPLTRTQLHGAKAMAALLLCLLPVILGFITPLLQLIHWALLEGGFFADSKTWTAVLNVLLVALPALVLTLLISLCFAEQIRANPCGRLAPAIRLASSGYAIPGTVMAVGVMIPLLTFDKAINHLLPAYGFAQPGLLFTGTLVAIIYACVVRFLAVALSSVESALANISPMMDDAATMLGHTRLSLARRIHMPMLRGGLLMAGLMVFMDVVKELPATLLLRPFNFETLAIRTYELAKDEQLIAAAAPALMMVALCLPIVILMGWQMEKTRASQMA